MYDSRFWEASSHVQTMLDQEMPHPRSELKQLCTAAAESGQLKEFAKLRRLVIDIDDLVCQIRWHVAQGFLLLVAFPEIAEPRKDLPPELRSIGIVNSARLLLRTVTTKPNGLFFDDPLSRWNETTAGSWVCHMFFDSAILRSIATLDRLARVANIATGDDAKGRIYFNQRCLAKIHKRAPSAETHLLMSIAARPYFETLTDYRHELAHNTRPFSDLGGLPPGDVYVGENNELIAETEPSFAAHELAAVAVGGFLVLTEALGAVGAICARDLPRVRRSSVT